MFLILRKVPKNGIYRKIFKSEMPYTEIKISDWIDRLQTQGWHAFSLEQLREDLPGYSAIAAKRALSRLSDKQKAVSIARGYYLIIPPEYAARGILPVTVFLDAFMKHLNRPYYLALLSAAAMHGSSHQQPQEFYVVTGLPALRTTHKKGVKINYISKKLIKEQLLESIKTESGYLKISNPLLTACDLLQFEKHIGGLNRAATVINDMTDLIKAKDFTAAMIEYTPLSVLQRLGFLLENVLGNQQLADALHKSLLSGDARLFRAPLKASGAKSGKPVDERWKVIVNTNIRLED